MGVKSGRQYRMNLFVDQIVPFAHHVPTLAVSEDHKLAANIFQHVDTDLTRERAVAFKVRILRTEINR